MECFDWRKKLTLGQSNSKGRYSPRICIHKPKCVTYLTRKSIKELEQVRELEVPKRTEAGENIKEGE